MKTRLFVLVTITAILIVALRIMPSTAFDSPLPTSSPLPTPSLPPGDVPTGFTPTPPAAPVVETPPASPSSSKHEDTKSLPDATPMSLLPETGGPISRITSAN